MNEKAAVINSHEEVGLIGGLEKRVVVIHDYDDQWPATYQVHAGIIAEALGDSALRLEHIGSTSVPGLAAKPIIDILLVVPNSAEESAYLPQLLAAGYELRVREPSFDEHRMVRAPERDVHVHIFSPSSKEIARYLAFRNRLRECSSDRLNYEQAKRILAKREWDDTNQYAEAKSTIVEGIISRGLGALGERG